MDAGFRHTCVDNTDGAFVYVRHHNTWVLDPSLQDTLFSHMHVLKPPAWMSREDFAFFRDQAATSKAPPSAAGVVNYKL